MCLDAAGFEAHHISAVSGNHSDQTIKCYAHICPPKKKREMCDKLSEKFSNPPKKKPEPTDSNDDQNKVSAPALAEFPTINVQEFKDLVPIENNEDVSSLVI